MDLQLIVKAWNAWGPNIQTVEDVVEWERNRRSWGIVGEPDVSFLPALFRRRFSKQSRMVMTSIQPCLSCCDPALVRILFASRWGDAGITTRLLQQIAAREKISPMDFSVSVHNTSTGLFSIHYKNREASTALAGGRDTFSYAMIEAGSWLKNHPDQSMLVVVSDEPLPNMYQCYADETQVPFSLAMVLASRGQGQSISLRCTGRTNASERAMVDPQALQFLRWLVSDQPEVVIDSGLREWRWQKQ